tara:strand:+ start:41 stop:586 length:546 start_codon:yes stop_codon:yes gene_type:complete
MPSQTPLSAPQTDLQIHDIHLPDQISSFPTAIGWWLLVAIFIIAAVWLIKKFYRNKKLNQSKNHALRKLKGQSTLTNAELITLLKWAAMQYFTRQQIANLYGEQFQCFLQSKLPEKHQDEFNQRSTLAFTNQYNGLIPEEGNSDCRNAVKIWLTHALPPIKIKQAKQNQQTKQIKGVPAHD